MGIEGLAFAVILALLFADLVSTRIEAENRHGFIEVVR